VRKSSKQETAFGLMERLKNLPASLVMNHRQLPARNAGSTFITALAVNKSSHVRKLFEAWGKACILVAESKL
jgi:hypothetical protein